MRSFTKPPTVLYALVMHYRCNIMTGTKVLAYIATYCYFREDPLLLVKTFRGPFFLFYSQSNCLWQAHFAKQEDRCFAYWHQIFMYFYVWYMSRHFSSTGTVLWIEGKVRSLFTFISILLKRSKNSGCAVCYQVRNWIY